MNPELRRNLWLEVTAQRLLATPAILLLVFAGSWLLDQRTLGLWTRNAALAAYLVITVVWGAKTCSAAFTAELEEGTWDSQRGSGLSAWSMTWGKLLGGAAMGWYGGLLCLLVYVASSAGLGAAHLAWALLALIGFGIAIQATALLGALAQWRKRRLPRVQRSRAVLNIVLILLVLFVGVHGLPIFGGAILTPLHWYGHLWPGLPFIAISAVTLAGWATLGAWRLMRAELQYQDVPWAWAAFLLFLTGYLGGWIHAPGVFPRIDFPGLRLPPALPALGLGGLLCGAATYLTIFHEPKDWLRLRRLALRWRNDRRRALHSLPLWLVSILLTAAFAIVFCATALLGLPLHNGLALLAGSVTLLCFLLRDILLVLWLNGGDPPSRRADGAAIVYLVVLYLLLPSLLITAHLGEFDGLFNPLVAFVRPAWVAAGVIEAALMAVVLYWRRHQAPAAAIPTGA